MRQRLSPYPVVGFLVLLACYGYFLPRFDNVNSTSRMSLVYAVADQGVLHIDEYHRMTIDKAFYDGHYYTEKSIGPSVLALPVYVAFRTVAVSTGLADAPATDGSGSGYPRRYHAMAVIVTTFLTVSIPSALAAVLLYALVRRWTRPGVALVIMLGYGLGTIAFPFSSQFFSHQLAAATAFAAFFLLWRIVREGASPAAAWMVGGLLGFAVVTEYVVGALALLLAAWAIHERRDWSIVARVVAAAAPWAVLLAAYNLVAFDSPLPIGYAHTVFFEGVHDEGLMGFTLPTWTALYGITFSPYRGLFFLSPFLLLAAPGLALLWRAGERGLATVVAAWLMVMVGYNAAYAMWWGGVSIGPRHLVPLLPFLCVPVALALQQAWHVRPLRAAALLLVGASVANVALQTVSGLDFPPDTVARPLTEYSLPRFLEGDLALNAGALAGLGGHLSLIPIAVVVAAIVLLIPRLLSRPEADTAPEPPRRA